MSQESFIYFLNSLLISINASDFKQSTKQYNSLMKMYPEVINDNHGFAAFKVRLDELGNQIKKNNKTAASELCGGLLLEAQRLKV